MMRVFRIKERRHLVEDVTARANPTNREVEEAMTRLILLNADIDGNECQTELVEGGKVVSVGDQVSYLALGIGFVMTKWTHVTIVPQFLNVCTGGQRSKHIL